MEYAFKCSEVVTVGKEFNRKGWDVVLIGNYRPDSGMQPVGAYLSNATMIKWIGFSEAENSYGELIHTDEYTTKEIDLDGEKPVAIWCQKHLVQEKWEYIRKLERERE